MVKIQDAVERKRYFSVKDAARIVGYSSDYITRIAREGKIDSRVVGRRRIINVDDLKLFELNTRALKRRQRERLQLKRLEELRAHEAPRLGISQPSFIIPGNRAAVLGAVGFFVLLCLAAGQIQFLLYTGGFKTAQLANLMQGAAYAFEFFGISDGRYSEL